jgi:hypothetical protein
MAALLQRVGGAHTHDLINVKYAREGLGQSPAVCEHKVDHLGSSPQRTRISADQDLRDGFAERGHPGPATAEAASGR